MNSVVKKILITNEEIEAKTKELAKKIDEDYKDSDRPLIILVILKGSMPFANTLMMNIQKDVELEFMKVSSYGANVKSSGEVKITLDLQRDDLSNLDILIVEDIIDSGRTLSRLTQLLKNRGANSVKSITLLDKPSRREVEFVPDYSGFVIENEFVIGYGLDYAEKYRNLPYIGVLKEEVYQ